MALALIINSSNQKFFIFIECLSSFVDLNLGEFKCSYILDILETYIVKSRKLIVLAWISIPVGIPGNELADKLAKYSLKMAKTNIKTTHTDFRMKIIEHIKGKWQAI